MERGSYSKLDQIEQIQIELTVNRPSVLSGEPSTAQVGESKKCIDYVLVHEVLRDIKDHDDDSVKEMRKFEAWRKTFERCLEAKTGLEIYREVVDIEEVS